MAKSTLLVDLKPLNANGVIHVGASGGEMAKLYHDLGVHKVLWFEKNPKRFESLYPNTVKFGMKQNYSDVELSDTKDVYTNKKSFMDFWRENATFIDVDTYDVLHVACKRDILQILNGFGMHLKGFRAVLLSEVDVDAFDFGNDEVHKFLESQGFSYSVFSATEMLYTKGNVLNVYG